MVRLLWKSFGSMVFLRFIFIGVFNTLIHWFIFLTLTLFFSVAQAGANLMAFSVAVTFSYFSNARWTFKTRASAVKYILYTLLMAFIAGLTGWTGQALKINPLLTLCFFSGISLTAGFIGSRYVIFRNNPS